MNSQNETHTFDIGSLAVGVLNAIADAATGGSTLDAIRASVLVEAWGRVYGIEPPTPDGDYVAKVRALHDEIVESALHYIGGEGFTYTLDGPVPQPNEDSKAFGLMLRLLLADVTLEPVDDPLA